MDFPKTFIRATEQYSDYGVHVPAPYFRKKFTLDKTPRHAEVLICGLGFYRLYINGHDVTKGPLAPYISNPDDLLYYDRYEVSSHLKEGTNVIGVCLGNGFWNNPGGQIWDFDKAIFRGAPQLAMNLTVTATDGSKTVILADKSFLTSDSPIYFDDYRCGEYYDARKEQDGWNVDPNFNDSAWKPAISAPVPRGECRISEAEPIVVSREIRPVSITAQEDGFLYDFGENLAGVCRLSVKGRPGQEISLYHGEHLIRGKLDMVNISFQQRTPLQHEYVQKSIYICKGSETMETKDSEESREIHIPDFVYNGFQYVFVKGVDASQADEKLLTYLVMHTKLEERGGFSCSDSVANDLQQMTRRSDLANFYYFPTDCPQREKNGWTADAALSAEHMLLNLSVENSYREWLFNIRKSQMQDGRIPGIVPTAGWGFEWGNGPAWDSVLIYLPYFTYQYRGDIRIVEENVTAIFLYLHYLTTRRNEKNLLEIGLGDWCPVGRGADQYEAPLALTDSIISMDLCQKAAFLFDQVHMTLQRDFALKFATELRDAVRRELIDPDTKMVAGDCQTSQAMAIFYRVFEPDEMQDAFQILLAQVTRADNHFTTGVLGGRVLFHVLSEFGYSDLAYQMITRKDYPSYGYWLTRGATSLWEDFHPESDSVASLNHHFWGDISNWFIRRIAGIQPNPDASNVSRVLFRPSFISSLTHAEGWHTGPFGKMESAWKRTGDQIKLTISLPDTMDGRITLEDGWCFEDGTSQATAENKTYTVFKRCKLDQQEFMETIYS